jgi:RimJ/RimL family protein N-acetyltransferase
LFYQRTGPPRLWDNRCGASLAGVRTSYEQEAVMADPDNRIELAVMTEATYGPWVAEAIREYANDLAANNGLSPEAALARSQRDFTELLPQGPATPKQHVFSILAAPEPGSARRPIGVIWFAERDNPPSAFVYDFSVDEPYRGRGYGAQALLAIEAKVKALGLKRIGLHVFGHNTGARRLYERLGYQVTNVNMAKELE